MKVYHGLEHFSPLPNAVVTQGTFDGVHLGHREILRRLREIADQEGGETVLITFHPHPRLILFPEDHGLELLSTLDEKIHLLEGKGLDHLIILPFTRDFSRLSSLEFIRDLIVERIGTRKLVIGYDHRFGRNREGSFEHLKEFSGLYGFETEEIPARLIDEVAVSSTKIRKALKAGDIDTANTYLGQSYLLTGTVVMGKQLGRTIGYPTANLQLPDPLKLVPAHGVYAAWARVNGETYPAMLNIGIRPTVDDGQHVSIEAHLIDFSADIYGCMLELHFVKRLRDEQRFSGLEALKEQLAVDKQHAVNLLRDI